MIITSKNFFSILNSFLPEKPLIIEAGAFKGKDTKKMATYWPNSIIHAFEPIPEIFSELCLQTKMYHNIFPHKIALSNKTERAIFYCAQNPKKPEQLCQAGSLCKPFKRLEVSSIIYPQTIMVNTITLVDWLFSKNLEKINLLWLDVQGHEFAILEASQDLLKNIQLLYLEVNFIEAYENQPTYKIINNWLLTHDFYPIAQDFTNETTWFFGNVLYHNKKFRLKYN